MIDPYLSRSMELNLVDPYFGPIVRNYFMRPNSRTWEAALKPGCAKEPYIMQCRYIYVSTYGFALLRNLGSADMLPKEVTILLTKLPTLLIKLPSIMCVYTHTNNT